MKGDGDSDGPEREKPFKSYMIYTWVINKDIFDRVRQTGWYGRERGRYAAKGRGQESNPGLNGTHSTRTNYCVSPKNGLILISF